MDTRSKVLSQVELLKLYDEGYSDVIVMMRLMMRLISAVTSRAFEAL